MASLVIKDAEIYFKNFCGKELPFNPAGRRTFCVRIDGRKARKLKKDGWSIKTMYINKSRTKIRWYLPVTIYDSYGNTALNSRISVIIGNSDWSSRKQLNSHSMGLLDIADITKSLMVIRGFEYNVNGQQGIKAYLRYADIYISDNISTIKMIDFLEGIE